MPARFRSGEHTCTFTQLGYYSEHYNVYHFMFSCFIISLCSELYYIFLLISGALKATKIYNTSVLNQQISVTVNRFGWDISCDAVIYHSPVEDYVSGVCSHLQQTNRIHLDNDALTCTCTLYVHL